MRFNYYRFKLEKLEEGEDDFLNYIQLFGNHQKIEDEPFYGYLQSFEPIPYRVPEEIKDDFDYDLLLKLVAASFSSTYEFRYIDDNLFPDLIITLSRNGEGLTKAISSLTSIQIKRLFEIYLTEVFNLSTLLIDGETEAYIIETERSDRIELYDKMALTLKRERDYEVKTSKSKAKLDILLVL